MPGARTDRSLGVFLAAFISMLLAAAATMSRFGAVPTWTTDGPLSSTTTWIPPAAVVGAAIVAALALGAWAFGSAPPIGRSRRGALVGALGILAAALGHSIWVQSLLRGWRL